MSNEYEKWESKQDHYFGGNERPYACSAWNAALDAVQRKVSNEVMPIDQKQKITALINSLRVNR